MYKLFSSFSEADNYFRLYTITFDKKDFSDYRSKLDTIKLLVDSMAILPQNEQSSMDYSTSQKNLALHYANLKKQIDEIVFFAQDSLAILTSKKSINQQRPRITQSDSVMSKILKDTLQTQLSKDTIVKAKEGLFNRIFKAKNDTIVNKNNHEVLNVYQIDLIQRNISQLISTNERIYRSNLNDLRTVLQKLRSAEKELIISNNTLLNKLKIGIENLRQFELDKIRKAEEQDFALYKENAQKFGKQVIIALSIMLLMVLVLLFYQYQVASYEHKLLEEKHYASKIAEEKTSVLANISHEVRTPLVSLKGVVSLLKNNNNAKIDKEIIETIDNDITVINATINDILNLSKLESGTLSINFDYFSPYKLVEESIDLFQYQAAVKKINLHLENNIAPDLNIWSNAFRFKQVLTNIVSNAIKYTDKGEVRVITDIKRINNTSKVFIQVIDTGIGIPDSKKDQIFRKYYTVDDKTKTVGFGLGLYISKLLSEQLKGTISFTSEFGKGTKFTFEFPFEKSKTKGLQLLYSVDDIPKDTKIVFIDDSRISLFFIQQLFKNNQNIQLFESSMQAWSYIKNNPTDIVITDLIMPELDGWDILNKIKSDPNKSTTKVFICSAENMVVEAKKNAPYHFDGVIEKPINEASLVSTLLGLH